jgi:drug/metabolite transporter (DMT)-like permease
VLQRGSRSPLDVAAIAACALIWGTTWHAIKLQLGVVDPLVSVIYRFTLAAALLFVWCSLRREPVLLSASQHVAAFGVGICIFAIDYACVYKAETRVASAVVAIMFGATALLNLTAFRILHGQRATPGAWVAASLGACGVLLLSWGELLRSGFDAPTFQGLGLALIAVLGTVGGNLFAVRGERAASPLSASTAWSMAYGAAVLALYALLSGRRWSFDVAADYVGSLLYLAVFGSVVAFLLYFGIARRRGYTTASYISALTPLIAMLMSSLFEGKSWAPMAFAGVTLVVLGQWLLLRARVSTHESSAAATEGTALAQRDL